jgi:hypothetical protein
MQARWPTAMRSSMQVAPFHAATVLVACNLFMACSHQGRPNFVAVQGTVRCDGAPVPGGVLTFFPIAVDGRSRMPPLRLR